MMPKSSTIPSKTKVSAIVAMDKNRVIGNKNRLPWHLPADLKHFKNITNGKPIIMGRKTFESIGKPLPNRTNIILTRNQDFHVDNTLTMTSAEQVLSWAQKENVGEIIVIGGAEIYKMFLPMIDCIYLTIVQDEFTGDTFFPALGKEWREVSLEEHVRDENNPHDYHFVTLKR